MKNMVKNLGALLTILLLAGCASMPATYHPREIGVLKTGQVYDGLSLELTGSTQAVPIGQPLVFRILLRNVSQRAFWIPMKPQQGFYWTYANGKHDFFVFDRERSKYYAKQECLLLQPGDAWVLRGEVATYYFDKAGITEFMAELVVAQNTNPELRPFWSGRAISNPFGVCLAPSVLTNHLQANIRARQLAASPAPPAL
ncbi:MAG: hypothetical protein NTV49_02065 [Kiritimatiellaeota bacterium]|nr:hypothetical protein [Kiritimatiellota bacterium]